ncbi:YncE family protein [Sphingomonas sp. RT2P30]|uniref:YncE family protein n=1 Tax=Parasphingomonas halimpatiens TaxID=3096162 RepID=UPI002FC74D7B
MKPALLALAPLLIGASAPDYTLTHSVALGAPDRWDYVVFSGETGQVYVAHGDRVTVVDAKSGSIVGQVTGIPGGTHGIAVSRATGQGFTDDGDGAQAVAFDLKTLKVTHRIPAAADADAITIDRASGHVFVVDGEAGKISVIDAKTDANVATIVAGEKVEYIVADEQGSVFAAGEDKSDLLKIDVRRNAIVARWATPDCAKPHGLALDAANGRLFMGCVNNVMMVVDARDGHVVAKLAIGAGSDAVAFDATRRRVFSSNGRDGTISVYQQVSPDSYRAMAPIVTAVSGRTMGLDPASGRLFVAAADTDPAAAPGGRAKVRPGTLKLLMFDPR